MTGALLALCERNPSATGGFLSQRASDAEKVYMTWRHYAYIDPSASDVALKDADQNDLS